MARALYHSKDYKTKEETEMRKELRHEAVVVICTHYGCGAEMTRELARNDSDTNTLARYICPVCGQVEEEIWD
ncbi:MAG: hypothetical protein PHD04_00920 [Candidatus Pacebacteria bacterium]|nr:hypothetical protein [Candidatus Paceibacterota bacterium]